MIIVVLDTAFLCHLISLKSYYPPPPPPFIPLPTCHVHVLCCCMYLKKDKHAHIWYKNKTKTKPNIWAVLCKEQCAQNRWIHTHTKEDVAICVLEEEGDILFSSFCLVVLTSRSKCTQPCLGRRENSPSNEHWTKPCIVESVDAGIPGPLRIAAAL